MYLIKDPKKSPFYQIIITRDDKRTTISTKTSKKSEALQFLTKLKFNIENQKRTKPFLLSEFRKEYLEYVKNTRSLSYIRSIEFTFNHIEEYFGDILIQNFEKKNLEKYFAETFNRSKSVAYLHYRTLKAAFSKAEYWEYLKVSPMAKLRLPKMPSHFPAYITKDEFQKILDVTDKQLFKDLFTTAFLTGMRLGEILNLTWDCIEFENRIITVKNNDFFTTKGKQERIIPLNDFLLNQLKNRFVKAPRRALNSFVFTKVQGIKLNENYVSKSFKKIVRLAGLGENVKFHSLRHSFAYELIKKGVNLFVIKELLGHQEINTTLIYCHLQFEDKVNAINYL